MLGTEDNLKTCNIQKSITVSKIFFFSPKIKLEMSEDKADIRHKRIKP